MDSPNPFVYLSDSGFKAPTSVPHHGHAPKQNLRYNDVPPLSTIVLRRGRCRISVNPYSAQHARLTGHSNTPSKVRKPKVTTPRMYALYEHCVALILTIYISAFGGYRVATDAEKALSGSSGALGLSRPVIEPMEFPLLAALVQNPGDVAEASILRHLGSPIPPCNVSLPPLANPADARSEAWTGMNSQFGENDLWYPTSSLLTSIFLEGIEDREGPASSIPVGCGLVTVPAEVRHRKARSPYSFRGRKECQALRARYTMARPQPLPLDMSYLRRARVRQFQPATVRGKVTSTLLLFQSASILAGGITIAEFGRVYRRCSGCDRYVFVERSFHHDCTAASVDVAGQHFALTTALYEEGFAGLTASDIEGIYSVCDTCSRIYMFRLPIQLGFRGMFDAREVHYLDLTERRAGETGFDSSKDDKLSDILSCKGVDYGDTRPGRLTSGKRTAHSFQVNDYVWLSAKNIAIKVPTRKLGDLYLGPFKITEKVGDLDYRLQLPDSLSRLHPVFHIDKLYPWKGSDVNGILPPPPDPIELDGEEEKRGRKKAKIVKELQYLVSWKGFNGLATWEPEDNLTNAREVVDDFHRRHPSAPQPVNYQPASVIEDDEA
ncbi:hypothetical protein NMY22_g7422 [Coprinellus aureogranulatus]|nr:hypothetical protein NMY22_g7422 [Coprinellus aureogranulatus]